MRPRWLRILPHVVDTGLLVSGIYLAIRFYISPLSAPWFAAKLVALVGYIFLGAIALRHYSVSVRGLAALGALTCVTYMALAALNKSPVPW